MDDFDALLSPYPAPVRALARDLRQRLLNWSPELRTRPQPGWGGIGFHHPRAGYVAALFPAADAVKLLFEWGVALHDPEGLLQGDGKRCRHLRLKPGTALPEPAIQAFLFEAIALRAPHAPG